MKLLRRHIFFTLPFKLAIVVFGGGGRVGGGGAQRGGCGIEGPASLNLLLSTGLLSFRV